MSTSKAEDIDYSDDESDIRLLDNSDNSDEELSELELSIVDQDQSDNEEEQSDKDNKSDSETETDNIDDQNNDQFEEEVIEEEEVDIDDEEKLIGDELKCKPFKRRKNKRRLFPFIQNKRRLDRAEKRVPPYWHNSDFNIREESRNILTKIFTSLTKKNILSIEKAINNSIVRIYISRQLEINEDSLEFKYQYLERLRYVIGAYKILELSVILAELKDNKWGYNSSIFASNYEKEMDKEEKIKYPDEQAIEDKNYTCPKCGGIITTRRKIQDRSGDEGMSLHLRCVNKNCMHKWRLIG